MFKSAVHKPKTLNLFKKTIMSSGPGNSNNHQGFPNMDGRFRDMRDKMNRDREAFFTADSPFSSEPSQPFFGHESPFFRVRILKI